MKTEKQTTAERLLHDTNNALELQWKMFDVRCLLHEYDLQSFDRTVERDHRCWLCGH